MTETVAVDSFLGVDERSAMTVWPTIAATSPGRWVGRLSAIRTGLGSFFTIGSLLAVATLPVSMVVYALQLAPFLCRRYTLTDRRLVVQKGLSADDERSIPLQDFDTIDVDVLAGQEWHHAGELIFRCDGNEVFRLSGVSRPEVFRQVCLKARQALVSVHKVIQEQATAKQTAS